MSENGKELVMRRVEPVPGVPDRATRVASWLGWHTPELLGVTVPVLATGMTPWAWLVSGVVGAGWTLRAAKTARDQAAIKAGRDLPALKSGEDMSSEDNGRESGEDRPVSDASVSGVDGKRTEGGAR